MSFQENTKKSDLLNKLNATDTSNKRGLDLKDLKELEKYKKFSSPRKANQESNLVNFPIYNYINYHKYSNYKTLSKDKIETKLKLANKELNDYILNQSLKKCYLYDYTSKFIINNDSETQALNENNKLIINSYDIPQLVLSENKKECIRIYSDILSKKLNYIEKYLFDENELYKAVEGSYNKDFSKLQKKYKEKFIFDSQYYGTGSSYLANKEDILLDKQNVLEKK